jgi:hypothetical protein
MKESPKKKMAYRIPHVAVLQVVDYLTPTTSPEAFTVVILVVVSGMRVTPPQHSVALATYSPSFYEYSLLISVDHLATSRIKMIKNNVIVLRTANANM